MTESVYLFFFLGALYAMLRWRQRPESTRWLAAASAFTALATLSRYEAWVLPGVLAAVCWLTHRPAGKGRRLDRHELQAVLASCAGIAAWFLWNWYLYDNPLRFAMEIRSAGFPEVRDRLQSDPAAALDLFSNGVLNIYGPLLPALAAWVALHPAARFMSRVSIALLLPGVFTLLCLLLGYVQMDEWGWNIRYALVLGPLAGFLAGIVIWTVRRQKPAWSFPLLAAIVLGFSLAPLLTPAGVVVYRDAARQFHDDTVWATDAGRNLGKLYHGGGVALFTGQARGQRIMIPSGLDLRHFELVMANTNPELVHEPWRFHRYLVLELRPDPGAEMFSRGFRNNPERLFRHYTSRWRNRDYLLLERRENPMAAESRESGFSFLQD